MTPDRYATFAKYAVGFDLETHLVQVGLKAPPIVCGAIALVSNHEADVNPGQEYAGITGELLDKDAACEALITLLEDEDRIIVGAHIAYDMLCCIVHMARKGVDIMPLVFRAYEQGRVFDVLIAEALNAIADGHLGEDPFVGGDLRDPVENYTTKYYSLAIVTWHVLNRINAKVNDEWRLKYYLLENIPIADWPPAAQIYPVDDTRNTLEDALAQVGILPKRSRHRWRTVKDDAVCVNCGVKSTDDETSCWVVARHKNLHQMADQAWTAFAMHLGAAWGFSVDQDAVDAVEKQVLEVRKKVSVPLIEAGLLKWKKEKGVLKLGHSKSATARLMAEAHGATGTCSSCGGSGKVVSPKKKLPTRRAWDPQKDGINCKECCATGFDLSTAPSLTFTEPSGMYPNGQIGCGADQLNESGNDTLRLLADYDEDAKTVSTYIPYLRTPLITINGKRYNRPLTLRPNVLLETDRVSYGDAIQQFPRSGGLRACLVARKGFTLVSCDYNQGEVITHAQSTFWILGYSKQMDIVLDNKEVHSMFGATVLGVSYDEFFAKKKKVKSYANARQAAKPWVFGKPGGMGVVKLVQTQRKQGPDTPCPNGTVTVEVEDSDGNVDEVPGYRGLRFCILMDGADRCGGPGNMTYVWGKGDREKPISPTCTRCLQCAQRLEQQYYETFPEARAYFRFTDHVTKEGQTLTDEQCAILDLPPGSTTEPGQMVMHVSNMLRGGVRFNDCSNGYFQSLLAVAAKMAIRIAQRECCDSTILVPTDVCPGGKLSAYAGQRSPLFGSRCIVLQHDEIVAELRDEKRHDAAMRLSEIMVRCLQIVCPDMASRVEAPPALMKRVLKAAEPVYVNKLTGVPCEKDDPAALLIPWEPPPKKPKRAAATA